MLPEPRSLPYAPSRCYATPQVANGLTSLTIDSLCLLLNTLKHSVLHKWNHITRSTLSLASFTQYLIYEMLCVGMVCSQHIPVIIFQFSL